MSLSFQAEPSLGVALFFVFASIASDADGTNEPKFYSSDVIGRITKILEAMGDGKAGVAGTQVTDNFRELSRSCLKI